MTTAIETYANNKTGVVGTTNVLSGDTQIIMFDLYPYPLEPNFRILIDSEIMIVTSIDGVTIDGITHSRFAVTRGAEGTGAVAHTAYSNYSVILTAGSLAALVNTKHGGTVESSRPNLNFVDGGGVAWSVSDDSSGNSADISGTIIGGGGIGQSIEAAWVNPILSGFTKTNQGTATVNQNACGGIYVRALSAGSNDIKLVTQAVPFSAATPWTLTAKIIPCLLNANSATAGLYFIQSSTSKMVGIEYGSSPAKWTFNKYATATSAPTSYGNIAASYSDQFWVQLKDDGTNITASLSVDGVNWMLPMFSEARLDYMAATGANTVGFGVQSNGSGADALAYLVSWQFGT